MDRFNFIGQLKAFERMMAESEGNPYPQDFNGLDPMTPAQRENSRRVVADATFHASPSAEAVSGIAGMGLPFLASGFNVARGGLEERNPMKMVRGGGIAAMGAAPWLSGPAALAAGYGGLGTQFLDDTIPQAQAAEPQRAAPGPVQAPGMPPLPVRRPPKTTAPQPTEVTTSVPPAQPPQPQSMFDRGMAQIANNYQNVADYAGRVWDDIKKEWTSQPGYKPVSYDTWVAENAADRKRQIESEITASRTKVDGVSSRSSDEARSRAAARAAQIEQDLRAEYATYKADMERRANMRFAERNPSLAAGLMATPMLLAAGRYRGQLARRAREIRYPGQEFGMFGRPRGTPTATPETQNAVVSAVEKLPNPIGYFAAGLGGSTVAKTGGDVYDMINLPPENKGRQAALDNYTTWDGWKNIGGSFLGRAALMGGLLPLTRYGAVRQPSASETSRALDFAGAPNYIAAGARASAQRKMDQATQSNKFQRGYDRFMGFEAREAGRSPPRTGPRVVQDPANGGRFVSVESDRGRAIQAWIANGRRGPPP